MRFLCQLRSILALLVVENTDFEVIWLRKQRYYTPLKRSEISKIIEMGREGSDLTQKDHQKGFNTVLGLVSDQKMPKSMIFTHFL